MKTDDQIIAEAHRERLNQGLLSLAAWCQARAAGDHDTETTMTMLERKATDVRVKVMKAGWRALDEKSLTP
jgi:hypothetical protein